MNDDSFLKQMRTFGALGYDPERIANLMDLHGHSRNELIARLSISDDPVKIAYDKGQAIGDYNIDIAVLDQADKGDALAIEMLASRTRERSMKDMKKKLFGV